jgi:hypothetical protein
MDEDNPEKLATFVYTGYRTKTIQRNWQHLCTQDTGRRQSRETGNICVHRIQYEDNPEKLTTFVYTGYRTKTIQRNWQHLVHRIQDEDNPEKLATFVYTGYSAKTIQRN